jgi:hypothetical protein
MIGSRSQNPAFRPNHEDLPSGTPHVENPFSFDIKRSKP